MAEYIDKQAYNDAIREAVRKYPSTFYNGLEVARKIAHDMSAADVVPVRHGRWVYEIETDMFQCSCCNGMATRNDYPFCHWCGASMDGGKEPEGES